MNFDFTPEQLAIKKMITEFANSEVKPFAQDIDHEEIFPEIQIKKLAKLGIMGMSIPEKYGGTGLDNVSQTIIMEELSRACSSTAVTMGAHTSLTCYPLVNHGTEDQKQRFLPKLASGEYLGAFALTEPNAGSDAVNVQTTAVKDGDGYIINGNKIFITNGGKADLINFVATTDRSKKHHGLSIFTIETKNAKGFSIGKKEDKLGLRGSNTQELIFQDMYVPKENLVGGIEGDGFKIAMGVFNSGRIGIGVQGIGIAQAAFDECLKYVKEREQFGRKLHKFQAIQFMLADMATKIEAARMLCYRAAHIKDMGRNYIKAAAMAKLYGSDIAMEVTRQAIQIHGGYGYIKDYPLERFYRDAKITEIYEGTSEIQKLVIAAELLGRGF
ncbi:MAG: acyl-CoA dehydrogenase family protein [Nanoarchaeota archaeon]|nr:acyl-CoA dehydrogenase family protein [Nanoarchaeota archaeon]MBU1945680.1 acyl-CoA dehydrogenase family protein [Nanoarchaeota archaeon]